MPPVSRTATALVLAGALLTFTATATAAAATALAPACHDVSNEPTAPRVDPAHLSTFGPLAAEPAMRVHSAELIADAHYVPGGVLVETTSEAGSTVALTLVDDSGAIRWRRCAPPDTYLDVLVAPPPTVPQSALVLSYDASGAMATEELDLASGTPGPMEGADAALEFGASSPGWVVFRPSSVDPAPADPSLRLVDLSTLATTSVPSPPVTAEFVPLAVSATGVVGAGDGEGPASQVVAAFLDGRWSADPGGIDGEFGVWADGGIDTPMTFRHASGAEAFATDLLAARDEGFHDVQVGDVVLVRGCGSIEPESFLCADPAFVGYDVASGAELWRFAGDNWVWAAGDGYAIVGGPLGGGGPDGDATMIDVSTGVAVEGQSWPQGTFFAGCCGELSFTAAEGGVALTSDGKQLSLYVPEAAATATVDFTI